MLYSTVHIGEQNFDIGYSAIKNEFIFASVDCKQCSVANRMKVDKDGIRSSDKKVSELQYFFYNIF